MQKINWQTKKLGEVCEIGAGNSAPQKKEFFINGENLFFRTSDVGQIHIGLIRDSVDKLNDKGIKKMKLFTTGTLLFPKSGASTFLNHRVVMDTDGYVSSHLATIKANKDLLNDRFLFYFSLGIDSRKLMQDQNYPSLRLSDISNIKINLPSLLEQKRIVKILDETFEKLEKIKENTEKNLQNSKDIFESYLESVFINPEKNWNEKTLKEITTILGDGLHGTPKYTLGGEYYFINGNNLDNGKILLKESTKRVSVLEYEKYKKDLNDRTILVSINGTLGNVAFYNNERIILGKSACYFNLVNGVDKNFIRYVLISPYFIKYAHREATGATIKNVSLKTMRDLKINLPPLEIQKSIVKKLDQLSEQTKKLESIYQKKLESIEELKKSILNKAFTGKL